MGNSLEAYRSNIGTFQFRRPFRSRSGKTAFCKSKIESYLASKTKSNTTVGDFILGTVIYLTLFYVFSSNDHGNINY